MKLVFRIVCGYILMISAMANEVSKLQLALNKQIVEDKLAVGAVVTTYQNGEFKSFDTGGAEVSSKKAINRDVLFEIGSISKAFTGILLADMVLKGEVKLDDPVEKYLPKGVNMPSWQNQQITLKHLANHTSSLPALPNNLVFKDLNNPYANYSVELLYEFLNSYQLTHEIGTKSEYSNLAVGLLGHVLSLAANQSYESLLSDRILKPLGMKNTFVTVPHKYKRAVPHNAAGEKVSHWDFPVLASAGAINSTIDDMSRFLKANIEPSGSLKQAIELSHQKTAGYEQSHIGLGWVIEEDYIWHNGGTGGFRTFLGFDKKDKKGIIILANQAFSLDNIGVAYMTDKLPQLLDKLYQPAFELSEQQLSKLNGRYQLVPGFELVVTNKGKQLMIQATNQANIPVYAKSHNRFYYKVVKAEVEFELDDNGNAVAITLFQAGREMKGRKL